MKPTKQAGTAAPASKAANPNTTVAQYDWSKTGATGFENVQREDLGIPFLVILQAKSPEVDPTSPEFGQFKIEGASQGDVVLSLSRTVVHKYAGTPISFVPCSYEKLYVEWKPRESGGGMVKVHRNANILNECQRDDRNRDVLRNGNLIVTTAYFYGLLLSEDGERVPCVIGMSSTQLKKSRSWLNMQMAIKMVAPGGQRYTPPMFSHVYHLATQPESNTEGSWFGWKITCAGAVADPALIADAIETAKRATAAQRTALPPAAKEPEADNVPFA